MISATLFVAVVLTGQNAPKAATLPRPDVRCGGFCLFVALQALGTGPTTLAELEKGLGPPGPRGYSMRELQVAAERVGVSTLAVETSLANLRFRERPLAVIGLLNDDHYVLISDITTARVTVIDPPRSSDTSLDAFGTVWNGKALLLSRSPLASEQAVKRSRIITESWPIMAVGLGIAASVPLLIALVRRIRHGRRPVGVSLATWAGLVSLAIVGGCDHPGPLASPVDAVTSAGAAIPETGSWLFIPEERKDLGTILKHAEDQEASFPVMLENRGPSTLEIGKPETSCACTRATLSRRQIPPGGFSTLTAFVRVGDNLAANSARIILSTSDPVTPRREIVVNWQVDVPLRTDVTSLDLPPLGSGETVERTLPIRLKGLALCPSCRLQARSESQMTTCSLDPIQAELSESHARPLIDDQFRVVSQLRLQVHPQTEENFYRDTTRIELIRGDDHRAGFTLPMTWTVAPVVQAAPDRVFLGTTKPGEAFARRVILHSRSGDSFRLTAIDPCDRVEISEPLAINKKDTIHHLELTIRAPREEGPWREVVRVRTDHPGGLAVPLSFSGIVNSDRAVP